MPTRNSERAEMLSWGFAFDNSAVGTPMRTVNLPVGDQYRFGAGVRYAFSKENHARVCGRIHVPGRVADHQTSLVKGSVAGQFTNTLINLFSLNMIYKFGIH